MREMVEIFEERGMSHEDAELVILTMAKYKDFFVDVMMTQELELQVPEEDHVKEAFHEGTLLRLCEIGYSCEFLAHPILLLLIISFRHCHVFVICHFWSLSHSRIRRVS